MQFVRRNLFCFHRLKHRAQLTEQLFMHKEDGHTVETPVEARAGFLGRPTLVVLFVSTGATIGFFALIYIGFFVR